MGENVDFLVIFDTCDVMQYGMVILTISLVLESYRYQLKAKLRYFPQQVLLCTSSVNDQSTDICIQGY